MANPPDQSQPDRMTTLIHTEVQKILSDPDQYPDPMVSWLGSFILLTASGTGSITA